MSLLRLIPLLPFLAERWIYLALRAVFTLARDFLWLMNGTYSKIWENRKPENYDTAAHVMKIIYKKQWSMDMKTQLRDFVLIHKDFVAPEYVLRDYIYLMQITENEAIFVEKFPGSQPHEDFSFEILGIHHAPKNIITMPLHAFNRLAEAMPKNDAKIIFVQNQSRCGGTLLTNVFRETGRCITFGEPHVFNTVVKFHYTDLIWDREYACRMMRNVVMLMCKPRHYRQENTLAYVIKPILNPAISVDLIGEALPGAIQLFTYRNPVTSALSLLHIANMILNARLILAMYSTFGGMAPWIRWSGCCDVDMKGFPSNAPDILQTTRMVCGPMSHYLRYQESGGRIHGIRYDMLIAHQEVMIRKIFSLCGVDESLVTKGLQAFKKDSQMAVPFNREALKRAGPKWQPPTADILGRIKNMLQELCLPDLVVWEDENYCLPGSIKF